MKKVFLFLVVLVVCFAACKPSIPSADENSVVNPEFFYTVKDTVVKGDNTWDKSVHYFADGYGWTDIVNNNKFLQEPGRVWQDAKTGTWYCLILPGEVLDMGTKFVNPVFAETGANEKESTLNSGILGLSPSTLALILLIIILIIAVAILLLHNYNRNNIVDPVTAGYPQVPGGVNDAGAARRLNEIARNRFPESRQRPRNIRRANLTGRMRVYYGQAPTWWKLFNGNKPYSKVMNIRNVPAYAGEITVNGQDQTIYFFQGCGNDAVQGNYMIIESDVVRLNENGTPVDVVSSPDAVNAEEQLKQSTEEKVPDQPKTEKTKQNEVLVDAEILKVASNHEVLADKFLSSTNAHKVVLKVNLPNGGSIETTLETKNQPIDSKKEEKK